MVTYYIESPTGKYVSEDGKRRFDRYTGTSAYEYLNSEEAEGKRFLKTFPYEDPYHEVYIEIPSRFVKEYRQEERREQYLNDVANESGYPLWYPFSIPLMHMIPHFALLCKSIPVQKTMQEQG